MIFSNYPRDLPCLPGAAVFAYSGIKIFISKHSFYITNLFLFRSTFSYILFSCHACLPSSFSLNLVQLLQNSPFLPSHFRFSVVVPFFSSSPPSASLLYIRVERRSTPVVLHRNTHRSQKDGSSTRRC